MQIPRIMIAGSSSGSGKTAITCAILSALKQKNIDVAACKCGPDYIDPMFHREVLQVPSENLDLFFSTKDSLQELFVKHGENRDIVVTEGVMGYYDGLALESDQASSYDVSRSLSMPTVLVVPCKGMALSVVPVILGMLEFRKDQQIKGIILNRISGMLYPRMKQLIESELKKRGYDIPVVGYVPEHEAFQLESRHLGLKLPEHIIHIQKKLHEAGELIKSTVDLEQILQIACQAPQIETVIKNSLDEKSIVKNRVRIGIARDEAFCFYYEENLRLLEEYGAKLAFFSPLHDEKLPDGAAGILLGGGYPELYAEKLGENRAMLSQIKKAFEDGVVVVAECGGFMYLHEFIMDKEKNGWKMAGVLPAACHQKEKLVRFGYIEIREKGQNFLPEGQSIRGHEFHYYDSEKNGEDCVAKKPVSGKQYPCIHVGETYWLGFPHLYYPSNPLFAKKIVEKAAKRKEN